MSSRIRGIIYIPTIFQRDSYVTDRYDCLFDAMAERFGFEVCRADSIGSIPDVDVVIVFKAAQHSNRNSLADAANLPKSVKLISYFVDLHSQTKLSPIHYRLRSLNRAFGRELDFPAASDEIPMEKILDRSDVIICPYDTAFRSEWPQHVEKYRFFPHFFAPYDRYVNIDFNESPTNNVFLSGSIGFVGGVDAYPVRRHIRDNAPECLVYLPHPGYHTGRGIIRDDYAKFISEHLGGVATASAFGYVVAKYFEIPAAGALLIGERVDDLDKLGFVPGEHYVPITKESAIGTVEECCANPRKYTEIRKEGMDLVRKSHSINNRLDLMEEVIRGVVK